MSEIAFSFLFLFLFMYYYFIVFLIVFYFIYYSFLFIQCPQVSVCIVQQAKLTLDGPDMIVR